MGTDKKYTSRRRVPRREYSGVIGVLVRGLCSVSRALQIGEGGMMILWKESMPIGQRLLITFRLPGTPYMAVRCTVRYVMPPEGTGHEHSYGIQFDKIDFNAKRRIRNYVASKEVEELPRPSTG